MISLLFFILTFTLLGVIFERVSMRRGPKPTFWHVLWETITLKAVNYVFNTSNARVTIFSIKSLMGLFWAYCLGWPTIKCAISSNGNFWGTWLSLEWGTIDLTVLIIIAVLIGAIVCFYLWKNPGKKQLIDEDKELLNKISNDVAITRSSTDDHLPKLQSEIENVGSGIHNIEKSLYKANSSNRAIIIQNIRTVREDIEALRIKSALNHLESLEKQWEEFCPSDSFSHALILYWKGCCKKFSNYVEAVVLYKQAFQLSVETAPKDFIIEGYIFALCSENKLDEAEEIVNQYESFLGTSEWRFIPGFLKANKKSSFFKNQSIHSDAVVTKILSESLFLTQILGQDMELEELCVDLSELSVLSYQNFTLWVLKLTVALRNFLSNIKIRFNTKDLSSPESEKLFRLTSQFLKDESSKEVIKFIPDVELYNSITGYFHDRKMEWITKLESQLENVYNKDFAYQSLSFALYDCGETDKAINLLKNYSKRSVDVTWNLIFLLIQEGLWDDVASIIDNLISDGQVLIPLNAALATLQLVKFYPQKFANKMESLRLENEQYNILYHLFISFFTGNTDETNEILALENQSPDIFKELFPLVYETKGDLDGAIDCISKILPEAGVNNITNKYVDLLEKANRLIDLWEYLKSLRLAGTIYLPYLYKEFRLAVKAHHHEDASVIATMIYHECPNDSNAIYNMIVSNHRIGNTPNDLMGLIDRIDTNNLNSEHIKTLFQILNEKGLYQEALDFLYDIASISKDQNIRDLYYNILLREEIMKIVESNIEVAAIDNFIEFSDGETHYTDYIRTGGNLVAFVGCSIGEEISINKGVKIVKLTLVSIQSKYAGLLKEVCNDINQNKSQSFISINFDDIKDDPLEGLSKVVDAYRGFDKEEEKRRNKELYNKYESGEYPLLLASKVHDLKSLYEMIFGDFKKIQISPSDIKNSYTDIAINDGSVEIVLDLSSLVLVHFISRKFCLSPSRKYIVAQRVVDVIEEQIIFEKQIPNALFGTIYTKYLGFLSPSVNGNSSCVPLLDILNDLKLWVNENCKIEISKEILTWDEEKECPHIVESFIESLMHAQRDNTIFVTEDIWLHKYRSSFCVVNADFLLRECFKIDSHFLMSLFTEANYVGHFLDGNYFIEQILLKEKGAFNTHLNCINYVRNSPQIIISVMSVAYKLEQGIITTERYHLLEELFLAFFEAIGFSRSYKLIGTLREFPITNATRKCLENAFMKFDACQTIVKISDITDNGITIS